MEKTMTNALTIYKDFDGLRRAAMALYKSGYFDDAKSEAQAIVKVMAGAEVGIPPFASMAGINIIQGKPTFGSNLIATIVDNHPRYAYKVKRADDKACVIEWYKDGELAGESSFTIEEARSIKQWNSKKNKYEPLTEKFNWQNWTSDMLFARAMTRGQKRYAAGVAGGAPMYTAEEMGVDEDGQGFIDAESITIEEPEVVEVEKPESAPVNYADGDVGPDKVDQAIADAGPDLDEMTIEKACAVTNSEGELYGDLSSDKLSKMSIGIAKGLKKDNLTDEQRQTYEMKQEAVKVILQARSDGSI